MEGLLYVPPDKHTILGRALWKPRYVVLGLDSEASEPLTPRKQNTLRSSRSLMFNTPVFAESSRLALFVYKQKGDLEPLARYPLDNVRDCSIQEIAQRRPGPVLPTLVLSLADSAEMLRDKRRTSQTSGALAMLNNNTNSKPRSSDIVWFRSVNTEENSIFEWCREICSQLQAPRPRPSVTLESPNWIQRAGSPLSILHSSSSDLALRGEEQRPSTMQNVIRPSSSRPSLRSRGSTKFNLFNSLARNTERSAGSTPNNEYDNPLDHSRCVTPLREHELEEDTQSPAKEQVPESVVTPVAETVAKVGTLLPLLMPVPLPVASIRHVQSTPPPPRRETILDRALARSPDVPTPSTDDGEVQKSSLAMFETLMLELDASGKSYETQYPIKNVTAAIAAFDDTPHGIPTPKRKALEFISTGIRSNSVRSLHRRARSRPTSLIMSETAGNNIYSAISASRRNSMQSIPDLSRSSSLNNGLSYNASSGISNSKRLSLSDFARRLSSSSLLQQGGLSRTPSLSDSQTSSSIYKSPFDSNNSLYHAATMPASLSHGAAAAAPHASSNRIHNFVRELLF